MSPDTGSDRPRTVAVIQARCGSSRLPFKVLSDLAGQPMLARVVERVQAAKMVDDVYVATSESPVDDPLEELARTRNWSFVRGSLHDVLSRFQLAAQRARADVIVRITADCPFIDPDVVDAVVQRFHQARPPVDYASNVWPTRTYPRGLDTEVFSRRALDLSAEQATAPAHREHVTQYILQNPTLFRTTNLEAATDTSKHRWTVDTDEDLRLAQLLYQNLRSPQFRTTDVLALLALHPEWAEINSGIKQKEV
jgi:spore coat polysaccharide biosynthesis protein SpsF